MKEDDFQYAIENTQVILAPDQKIATFGTTSFHFYLISELMDRTNEVRVRCYWKVLAKRPSVTPNNCESVRSNSLSFVTVFNFAKRM